MKFSSPRPARVAAAVAALFQGAAFAHEGHGMPGSGHWHATDTLGFVGLVVAALAVWWLGGRK